MRSSFSWALWRRLRCLPSPAASSISRRRSLRLGVDDLLDPALADHRVRLAAHVRVGERLEHVGEAAAGAVQAVLAVAVALDPARDRDLGELAGRAALGVVDHHLDLGEAAAATARCRRRRSRRASAGRGPRVGLCSPSAQSTASVMFDLPEPFGPTITLTPGEKVSRVRSGKDLKPFRLIAFRYIEVGRVAEDRREASRRLGRIPASLRNFSSARCAAACSASFLLLPEPDADLVAVDRGPDLEAAIVRRPLLVRSPRS